MSKSNQQCCRNIIDNTDDNLPSAIQPCKIYVVTKVHPSVKINYSGDLTMKCKLKRIVFSAVNSHAQG